MPPFEPTENHRNIVGLMAAFGIPQDRIRRCVINPRTGAPISKETLEKAFAEELQNGMAQMDLVCATAMAHQIKAGNTTMMIWFSKNRWGWSDSMSVVGKDDKPVEREHTLRIELVRPPKRDD